MKHHWHLPLNTLVSVMSLFVIILLLYTSTIKQDTKREDDYKRLCELIEKQQNNLETEQRIRQGMEREFYNWKAAQPEPTMETLIINKEALK